MKKFLLSLLFLLGIAFFLPSHALTVELVSDEGDTSVYNVVAEPPVESSAVQIRFHVINATIESINSGPSNYLMTGTCDSFNTFDGSDVCVDIAATPNNDYLIQGGDVLLVVTVNKTGTGEISFETSPDHAYLSTDMNLVAESGTILANLATPTAEPLDQNETLTNQASSLPIYLLIGILVILVAAFVGVLVFSDKGKDQADKI